MTKNAHDKRRNVCFFTGGMRMKDRDQDTMSKKALIRKSMIERQGEAKVVRKIILIIVMAFILVAGIIGIGGYLYVKSALEPLDPDNKKTKEVEIPIGSGVSSISTILEEEGIIKNGRIFKYYIKLKNEAGFQAGTYKLSPSMELDEVLSSIKSGKVMKEAALKITIPEGKQLSQIATIIADKTNQKSEDVLEKLDDEKFVKSLQKKHPKLLTDDIFNEKIIHPLEGYLFPATYSFYETTTPLETIVSDMLSQTEKVLSGYQSEMKEKKYSPHILLTFASLIEEEATVNVDRNKISSVFHNRLKANMPLQTDPTVLYAKGKHQKKVYYKDLEVESPYNTYKNKGLTPGPIANAGDTSIEAALHPDKTKYYYFLATSSGKVLFSVSLDEHNKKKAQYITNDK